MENKFERLKLEGIRVLNNDWPEDMEIAVYPGDFSSWAGDSGQREICYLRDPVLDAPKRRARGGVFFLNRMTSRDAFSMLLFNAGINSRKTRYAAFGLKAKKPEEENFFWQMKLVTNYALRDYFGALDTKGCEAFPRQEHSVGEALWRFMGKEVNACNAGLRDTCEVFDGENVKGRIRFGLAVERRVKVVCRGNIHIDGVYRVWSQPYYPEMPSNRD